MHEFPFKVEPLSEAEAVTLADFIVCRPASWKVSPHVQERYLSIFMTNEHGRCTECKRAIMFRPVAAKLPIKKICVLCFLRKREEEADTDDEVYQIFKEQALQMEGKL